MTSAAGHAEPFGKTAARRASLPERLNRHSRAFLAAGDAAVVLFVSLVVLNGGGSRIAAGIFDAAVICGTFWQCGLYRRSFAVHARDEVYYACAAILFAAVPVLLVLAEIANITLVSIILTLLFCAIGTSAVHVRDHLNRRIPDGPYAGLSSITPGAWHEREAAWFQLARRAFDISAAVIALAIAAPVMLTAALAIVAESGGPVFFRQERIGESGRTFRIFKFRTMRTDAGSHWAKPGDDRITRVGALLRRTSVDELPQLFNVLAGQMSIVGPRPEMVTFARSFAQELPSYPQRHVVAPGITGWAQLYLERNLDPSDMPRVLPYDLFYVEYASPFLDMALLLKTCAEVVFHRAV